MAQLFSLVMLVDAMGFYRMPLSLKIMKQSILPCTRKCDIKCTFLLIFSFLDALIDFIGLINKKPVVVF